MRFRQLLVDSIGPQLVKILQRVHAFGVVHRDVKPQNIVRCLDTRQAIFVDFGGATEQPASPQAVHTPAYASESVLAGNAGSFYDDWVSLGYTLYAVLSGDLDKFEQLPAKDRPSIAQLHLLFPYLPLLPDESSQKETSVTESKNECQDKSEHMAVGGSANSSKTDDKTQ